MVVHSQVHSSHQLYYQLSTSNTITFVGEQWGYARYLLPTNPLTNLMFRDCLLPTQSIINSNTSGPWLECGQTLVIVVFITAYVLVAHPTVLHLMLVMGTTANLAVILIQVISGSDQ